MLMLAAFISNPNADRSVLSFAPARNQVRADFALAAFATSRRRLDCRRGRGAI